MELEVHGHYGHHFSVTRRGPESGECWELEPGNGYFAPRKKCGQNKLGIENKKGYYVIEVNGHGHVQGLVHCWTCDKSSLSTTYKVPNSPHLLKHSRPGVRTVAAPDPGMNRAYKRSVSFRHFVHGARVNSKKLANISQMRSSHW